MSWVLILWIWTGQFGYPAYFGVYASKAQCEAMGAAVATRMPGNGFTVTNQMCIDQTNPLEAK